MANKITKKEEEERKIKRMAKCMCSEHYKCGADCSSSDACDCKYDFTIYLSTAKRFLKVMGEI